MAKGCGCQSGLLKYLPLPYAGYFYVACCMHDDDYELGGSAGDRRQADVRLYRRMTRTVNKRMEPPVRAWWLTTVAMGYYLAVRLMGWRYFKFK